MAVGMRRVGAFRVSAVVFVTTTVSMRMTMRVIGAVSIRTGSSSVVIIMTVVRVRMRRVGASWFGTIVSSISMIVRMRMRLVVASWLLAIGIRFGDDVTHGTISQDKRRRDFSKFHSFQLGSGVETTRDRRCHLDFICRGHIDLIYENQIGAFDLFGQQFRHLARSSTIVSLFGPSIAIGRQIIRHPITAKGTSIHKGHDFGNVCFESCRMLIQLGHIPIGLNGDGIGHAAQFHHERVQISFGG
mmetsp:Transcript_32167/g.53150  ORF Transcript_32167/g.53150 Transcript_32167/m.53150 type:complete len:244 (+) Transcript_32167:751-1482(+)